MATVTKRITSTALADWYNDPFDVEEGDDCPACHGDGYDEDDAPCLECGGQGYV